MDDTPWLTEPEMLIWRSFIEASGRLNTQLNDSLKRKSDLTLDDYEVLVHLSEANDQRLRMTELSGRLLHSQSRLTQRVDRLAKRGLVDREKCPDDRRGKFAVLTPAGLSFIETAAPAHVRDVRRLLIDLIEPHEQAAFGELLQRIAKAARNSDHS